MVESLSKGTIYLASFKVNNSVVPVIIYKCTNDAKIGNPKLSIIYKSFFELK